MITYGSGRTARSSIDLYASDLAREHFPASNASALAWRLDWEKSSRAGVAAATTRAAASGTRLRWAAGASDLSPPERAARTAPPTAKIQAVTAGISQSQSTPACTTHATVAASRAP